MSYTDYSFLGTGYAFHKLEHDSAPVLTVIECKNEFFHYANKYTLVIWID